MKRAFRHHNKRFLPRATSAGFGGAMLVALALIALAGAMPLRAAGPQQKSSGRNAKSEYSPYRASIDVNVGKFYYKKGKYDAALSRFLGAAKHDPGWAVPYRYIGKTYEKKNDPKQAVAAYRKYLKIKPYAKDAKDIKKRIEKLERKIKEREAENQQRRQSS
jgi:tetratricopeptide (TPR) repeat protein